jgi:UDP-3-O-[3-hydroxymyristoyl] glucosamine N-acyltransferase
MSMATSVRASEIAAFLGLELRGQDLEVRRPRSLARAEPHALLFAKQHSPGAAQALAEAEGAFAILHQDFAGEDLGIAHVLSAEPRMDFTRALSRFFYHRERDAWTAPTAIVSPGARIGLNVRIGHHSVIDDDVEIGDGVEIRDFVVIRRGTRIGADTIVKSHTLVGEEGFGFEFDAAGVPLRIVHLGGVVIGRNVEIGSMNVIARGTLDDTRIDDHAKIDDHVFIAHNAWVGENSVVIAGAEVSGSVQIGKGCWIAPQACIINQATIGDGALVGIGAVVTKNVEEGMIVAGNPAKVLRKR